MSCRASSYYNQTIFTAGDVDQFLSKLSFKNDEIINTFHYIYHKFKKGIFIHIIDNKLHTFLPFSKFNYINEWHDLLDKNNIKLVMKNLYFYPAWPAILAFAKKEAKFYAKRRQNQRGIAKNLE